MSQPALYVGLDVSLETTSICVVDNDGATVWRGSCPTDAAMIADVIRFRAPGAVRVGLETGQMAVNQAVEDLNALGLNYRLVTGTAAAASGNKSAGKKPKETSTAGANKRRPARSP